MSLINYVEPVNIGNVFSGIGSLIVMCVVAYIIYKTFTKYGQYFDCLVNREIKYELLEEMYLDDIAGKKGKNLQNELIKRKVINTERPRNLKKRIQDKVMEDMFGKDNK